MIEVEVHYTHQKTKRTGDDRFYYKDIIVKGHATTSNELHNVKICAGVTSIVQSVKYLFDEYNWTVTCKRGLFSISCTQFSMQQLSRVEMQCYNDKLDFMVGQLYYLYVAYPDAFRRFDLIDIGGKENYD